MGFTDNLPAGLVIATPNGLTGSCGGGTIAAVAGGGSISLAGAAVTSGASCSFSVNVIGTSTGMKTNSTSVVSSNEGGTGGGASTTLTVIRFNFAADPEARPENAVAAPDPFSSVTGSFASGVRGSAGQSPSRVDDTFGALAYAASTKAAPRYAEPKDWLGWAEVHGAILDRSSSNVLNAAALYGDQVNLIAGLTRKLRPDFLVGVLGGYETFDYRSDELQGRLKGDGWTIGSYLGWMLASQLRLDAAIAYSGIGYDGTAGTAAATFGGHRLLVSGGLTGTYATYGLQIEPSARVYALWERADDYTDTLGTAQAAHNCSTGRASGGVKLAYPAAWSPAMKIAPYVGLYGDYYFNANDAGAVAIASAIPAAIVMDGWSARATGGVSAGFGNGAQVSLGAERSGLGAGFSLWTYRAQASMPFAPQ